MVLAVVALVVAVVGVRFDRGWVAGLGFLLFCAFGVIAALSAAGAWALDNVFPASM